MELVLLLLSLLLILACGLFVAAEFSLIAVNRATVERLAAKNDHRAKGVLHALVTLSTQLSSAQVGITITNLAIGFLAEPATAKLIEGPITSVGLPEGAVTPVAVAVGLFIATTLTMLFGELVPKNLAIAKPLAVAKAVQRPLLVFTNIMAVPIKVLNGSANFILRQFGVEPQEELASARSADELISLVRRSAEKGALAKETATMLERSLNFGELTALDVMTPRVRIKSVRQDSSILQVLNLAKMTGFSRFPVYGKDLDDIVGVVHVKQAFAVAREKRSETPVQNIMRPAVLLPSSIQLEPLLEDLRKGGMQMAIVVDEFGAVDGVVTIEDLLEELVGEVTDEHDRSISRIRKRQNGAWQLSGLLRPDEIGEILNIYLPEEEDVETVGGLIAHQLERIPNVGDSAHFETVDRDGAKSRAQLTVERMDGNRVDQVELKIIHPHSAKGDKA